MNAVEGKCAAEDGDGMRHSARSTNVFSKMDTLESIPTLSDTGLHDNPLIEEIPDAFKERQRSLWRGVASGSGQVSGLQQPDSPNISSRFNYRKLMKPKRKQENNIEEANATTKEEEIEFEGRPVQFSFLHAPWKQIDEDLGFVDDHDVDAFFNGDASQLDSCEVGISSGIAVESKLFSGMSRSYEEACGEVPDAEEKVGSNECEMWAAQSQQSSTLETFERSATMICMPGVSLSVGSNVMVGSAGRALRRKRTGVASA